MVPIGLMVGSGRAAIRSVQGPFHAAWPASTFTSLGLPFPNTASNCSHTRTEAYTWYGA